MSDEAPVACVGCGALVPADGIAPDHTYIGASPGCWSLFTGLRGRESSHPRYVAHGRSITDAYMVQHPGVPGRQSSQSVWVHLVGLYVVIERGLTPRESIDVMRRVLVGRPRFAWLDPPGSLGTTTAADAAAAPGPDEYREIVRRWTLDAWLAWSGYHGAIRGLGSTCLPGAR